MIIGDFDTGKDILVVAEIGNNHEGNFEIARQLVQKAAASGVDAVKFQTFKTEHYVSKENEVRYNRLKSFELSYEQFGQLAQLAHSLGLLFISTPFDLASAVFLKDIVDCYKIASGDNNFYPLLERVAESGKPVIISFGLSDAKQASRTVAFVKDVWRKNNVKGQLAILHCVTSYPVPPEQANLLSIQFLRKTFDCTVGYSDHTMGLDAPLMAIALGARIVEKHFTLDKHYSDFRDHQLSADPGEMRELVRRIREGTAMLGTLAKIVQPSEEAIEGAVRRSIVAAKDLPKGHRITRQDLTWTRPSGGLAPGEEGALVGKRLQHDVHFGEQLHSEDVEREESL